MNVQFLLFTKLQFTRYSQNILRPNLCTHGHIWSWTVAHFRRSRAFAIGFKGLKTRWWRVSSFPIATEYNSDLRVSTDNKSEGLISGELGGFTSKSIFEHVLFFCFLWGTHSWYLSKYFMYILYILLSMPDTACHTHTKQQPNYTFLYLSIYVLG